MTNEELCLLIQQGHEELVPELWDQCRCFISMMAGQYVEGNPQLDPSLKEDCIQEAYFSFMDAIRLYKDQRSSFIHYLNYHLMNAFKVACYGGRSKKHGLDPLNHSISLDIQLGDGEDIFTLSDLVAEKEQGEQTEYVIQPELKSLEECDYWRSVNGFMHRAFDESSDEAGKEIYKYMLDHDCGFKDAVIGIYGQDAVQNREVMNRLSQSRRKTQQDFQRYWNSRKGKEQRQKIALDNIVCRNGLRSYGLKRFKSSGSFVESIVINDLMGG